MTNDNDPQNTEGWKLENSYAELPQVFYSKLSPVPVSSPELIVLNEPLAHSLGLNGQKLQGSDALQIFAGNALPPESKPLAQAYAGHQFGHFTMLGDGRAILLGEQITPANERYDIQLKGSGRTPYSRGGDGRAALGPMLREYIMSEAMHALGIPTTRSLAVVTTGEAVIRETELTGSILTRIASSHLRVGTFQYAAKYGTTDDLKALTDYAINRHYPEVKDSDNVYVNFFLSVIKRQARLIAQWQLVGFIHGVMNTDNMTISGETIDYGPCAFMNQFDPATVFSSIDREGRYAYGNQPYIGAWNLARLAEALLPLFHQEQEQGVQIAEETLAHFSKLFRQYWLEGMRAKLGLFDKAEQDEALIGDLLNMLQKYSLDYTNTFRDLTLGQLDRSDAYQSDDFSQWYDRWQARRHHQDKTISESNSLMMTANPAIIPRNHRVEEALEAATSCRDYTVMEQLLDVLSKPYAYTADQEPYTSLPDPSDRPYRTYCGT